MVYSCTPAVPSSAAAVVAAAGRDNRHKVVRQSQLAELAKSLRKSRIQIDIRRSYGCVYR